MGMPAIRPFIGCPGAPLYESKVSVLHTGTCMKHPSSPDTQPDEYLPEAPNAHRPPQMRPEPDGINPINPSSMPRGEDDETIRQDSPEFNDRPDAPPRPDR